MNVLEVQGNGNDGNEPNSDLMVLWKQPMETHIAGMKQEKWPLDNQSNKQYSNLKSLKDCSTIVYEINKPQFYFHVELNLHGSTDLTFSTC